MVSEKKHQSFSKILRYLNKNGSDSIASIAAHIHASVPSTTQLITELTQLGYVKELGQTKSVSGRRPFVFGIDGGQRRLLSIHVNLYEVLFQISNLENEIVHEKNYRIDIDNKNYLKLLAKELNSTINQFTNIWCIGLTAPGLIEKNNGVNHTHKNLNESNVSGIGTFIEHSTGIPSFVLNDTHASILGEFFAGKAKGKRNALTINLDWGIGLGILANGKVLNGTRGFAGELGHVQIDPNGRLCKCGKVGCLDTLASADAIVQNAIRDLEAGKQSILLHVEGEISLEDIISAANNSDEYSLELLYDLGRHLGKALSYAIHLFNPEIIIIDGILSKAGHLITTSLTQSVLKYCLKEFTENLKIVISPLKDKSKLFGTTAFCILNMADRKEIYN